MLLERPPEIDRKRLLFLHQVTSQLAEAGLPVPAAVPARDGRPIVTLNRRRYLLRPWVEGRRRAGIDLTIDECRELGRLLGRVHAELDALTPPVQQSLLIPVPRARDTVESAERLLADADTSVHVILRTRRDLLTELADHQPPEVEAVVAGYVHGAFRAWNLRYDEPGDVVAILGWERLRIAPFAGEVVRSAASLFEHADGCTLDLDRVEAFVEGHASEFELDAAQLRSAAHRLWWERLCDLGTLERHRAGGAASPDPPDPPDRRPFREAALVEWWTTNLERTLDAFAAAYERPVTDAALDADGDETGDTGVIGDVEPEVWEVDVDVDVDLDVDLSLV